MRCICMSAIENETQLKLTKYWITRFRKEVSNIKSQSKNDLMEVWTKLKLDSANSMIEELEGQIEEYENKNKRKKLK